MTEKVTVITGAGSGLGAELACRYSAEGDFVLLIGRTDEKLIGTQKKLSHPEKSKLYCLDIRDKAAVHETFSSIYREVGNVDILVNCAGVGKFDLAENISAEEVDAMIDINLKGSIYCTKEVLLPMKQADSGTIINVVSMSGIRPVATESVYCASKFGLTGFTRSLQQEFANTGVRVVGFYMGNMATDLWHGDRQDEQASFIQPADMADIILENTKERKHLLVSEVHVSNVVAEK